MCAVPRYGILCTLWLSTSFTKTRRSFYFPFEDMRNTWLGSTNQKKFHKKSSIRQIHLSFKSNSAIASCSKNLNNDDNNQF